MAPNSKSQAPIKTSHINEGRQPSEALATSYDVFLCYNSEDKESVRKVAEKLKRRGIRPWFDEWEVPPFARWQDELQRAIPRVRAAAVFLGPSGVGPWEDIEIHALLQEFARRRIRLGMVLLTDCPANPRIPYWMRMFHWVDFRKSNPDPLEQLIWGITGQRWRR